MRLAEGETSPMEYAAQYRASLDDPQAFWRERAASLAWYKEPSRILDWDGKNRWTWFPDGELNTCHLCLDRHVEEGRGDRTAIIYDSPVTGIKERISYDRLLDLTARFAGALKRCGVEKGDRVIIYMPMVPEAVVAMLACARLGAVHSVVFGGFAAHELCVRIDDAKPAVIVAASCGIEINRVVPYKPLLDEALSRAAHVPRKCIILQRPQCRAILHPGRDITWEQALDGAPRAECRPVNSADPLYILYTSGTTGRPKGIVRDNGGHAVALRASMSMVYGVETGDVFWAASDVGWVVGHSYIVYGPLLAGCTSVLFEGKPVRTPDASTFWRVLDEHRVNAFFTAPTAFRAVKKEDPLGAMRRPFALTALRHIFLAGERLDPPTYHWLRQVTERPVIDHWWQTETGWPIVAGMAGYGLPPIKPGSASLPVPGFDVRILDVDSRELPAGAQGDVVIRLPLPPGCLSTLWESHERFVDAYCSRHPGFYATGDGGFIDAEGYVFILGRTDDVINVAGHRLSTGEIEEVVAAHPAVAECSVIGVADELRGQLPVGFVVLKDTVRVDEAGLRQELVDQVRREIGAFACFRQVAVVDRLPKTRSGKILRAVMRSMADGKSFAPPSTIEDPAVLDEIAATMTRIQAQ